MDSEDPEGINAWYCEWFRDAQYNPGLLGVPDPLAKENNVEDWMDLVNWEGTEGISGNNQTHQEEAGPEAKRGGNQRAMASSQNDAQSNHPKTTESQKQREEISQEFKAMITQIQGVRREMRAKEGELKTSQEQNDHAERQISALNTEVMSLKRTILKMGERNPDTDAGLMSAFLQPGQSADDQSTNDQSTNDESTNDQSTNDQSTNDESSDSRNTNFQNGQPHDLCQETDWPSAHLGHRVSMVAPSTNPYVQLNSVGVQPNPKPVRQPAAEGIQSRQTIERNLTFMDPDPAIWSGYPELPPYIPPGIPALVPPFPQGQPGVRSSRDLGPRLLYPVPVPVPGYPNGWSLPPPLYLRYDLPNGVLRPQPYEGNVAEASRRHTARTPQQSNQTKGAKAGQKKENNKNNEKTNGNKANRGQRRPNGNAVQQKQAKNGSSKKRDRSAGESSDSSATLDATVNKRPKISKWGARRQ